MTAVGTVNIVWSNGADDFCAAKIGTLLAIEEACNNSGIAEIYGRLSTGSWRVNDVVEVIRLGLIGGGMSPEKAKRVVDIHVLQNVNGIAHSVLVAQRIVEVVLVGVPGDDVGKKQEAADENNPESSIIPTEDSAAQRSTELEQPSSGIPESSMSSRSGSSLHASMDTMRSTEEAPANPSS